MEWDDHAATWDDDPGVRAYSDAVFERVQSLTREAGIVLADSRVLDFGCGTGPLIPAMAERCREVVGLDASPKMIEVLRQKIAARGWKNVRAIVGTLEQARAREAGELESSFDLVVCSSVLAFVPDYPGTLSELVGCLRPGGLFVQFDWERDDSAEEPFGLSRAQVERALSAAELAAIRVETGFERPCGEQVMRPLLGTGTRLAAPA